MLTKKLDTRTEIWKDVKGYEGRYKVSNLGNVKSLASYTTRKTDYIMKGWINNKGYKKVLLSVEADIKVWSVHRIVAISFLENPLNLPQVNHIDEDKNNNHYSNLEWCTCKYNNNHGTRTLRATASNNIRKRSCIPVLKLDIDGNLLKRYESKKEALLDLGINQEHLRILLTEEFNHNLGMHLKMETPIARKGSHPKRVILKYNLNGELIDKYDSMTEASFFNKVSIAAVCLNVTGKTKICAGHKFKYGN